jgi:hypothetical protein
MKRIKQILKILIALILLIVATSMSVLSLNKFGQSPKGARLERVKKSPSCIVKCTFYHLIKIKEYVRNK